MTAIRLTPEIFVALAREHLSPAEQEVIARACLMRPEIVSGLSAQRGGDEWSGREAAEWLLGICRDALRGGTA